MLLGEDGNISCPRTAISWSTAPVALSVGSRVNEGCVYPVRVSGGPERRFITCERAPEGSTRVYRRRNAYGREKCGRANADGPNSIGVGWPCPGGGGGGSEAVKSVLARASRWE